MTSKKILMALSAISLSSLVLLSSNAQANYPQNYHGASASNLSISAEGTASYEGDIVTIPAIIKENPDHNFKFDDLSELYFVVRADEVHGQEVDATVTPVNQQTGLVNLSFDVSQMELDKPYRMSILTETMAGGVTEPGDITFKMNDKLVTISSNGIIVVTKDTETETKKENKSEEATTSTEKSTISQKQNTIKSQTTNKSVKTLPETSAVK